MPVSNPEHIPVVLHFVQAVQPRSVLDVGVGTGSYGLLLRQGLDIGHGRVRPDDWQVNIEGAEIFEGYRNPVWAYAYNRIHLGDIRQLLPTLPAFDLILCNDVLEHFEVEEARQLVRNFLDRGSVLVATTPNIDYPQGAWGGNEAERHHCLLRGADFHGLVAQIRTGITSCFVATNRRELVYPLLLAADRAPRVTPGRPMNAWIRLRRKWREWRLTRKS